MDAIAAETTIQLEISIFNLVSNSFSQKILSHNAHTVYTSEHAVYRKCERVRGKHEQQ